ncbi:MAG: cyclic nucleotide-binding domain-containing protein [Candidatus Tectomicrobia bacterium]|nr:cyclic nucleotide-binding domain-containing protein [Candidatus Tectomicrobia bacterium]
MRERYFAANTFLFHQGEPGESLFVIQQGRVEVLRMQPEGMQTVDQLHQGDVVGEMALVTGTPRMASAVAIEPTEVLEIHPRGVRDADVTIPSYPPQYQPSLHAPAEMSFGT